LSDTDKGRKSLIFAMALAMPGLVAAQQAELPKESKTTRAF